MNRKVLLALLFALTTVVHAAPPAEWMVAPDAAAEYVADPVFGGRVALYRAGPRNAEAVVLVHGLGKAAARDWVEADSRARRALQRVSRSTCRASAIRTREITTIRRTTSRACSTPCWRSARRGAFTLIGHSMGGAVALAYVAAYPQRVSRLVLVDAVGVLHRSVYVEYPRPRGRAARDRHGFAWFESGGARDPDPRGELAAARRARAQGRGRAPADPARRPERDLRFRHGRARLQPGRCAPSPRRRWSSGAPTTRSRRCAPGRRSPRRFRARASR